MRRRRHVTRVAAVVGVAAGVVISGCTNEKPASEGAASKGADNAAATGAGAGDSDSTGVTEDTIKIGWPTIDQSALVQAGLAVDVGDTTKIAQSIVGEWNAHGGINGRKVQLVKATFGADIANMLPDMQK